MQNEKYCKIHLHQSKLKINEVAGTRDLQYKVIFFLISYTVIHEFLYRDKEQVHTNRTLMISPPGRPFMFIRLFQTLATESPSDKPMGQVVCVCVFSLIGLFATSWTIGHSVHGISEARILEWVATSSSRGSSQPKDQTHFSCISCIVGRFLTTELPGKPMGQVVPSYKSN